MNAGKRKLTKSESISLLKSKLDEVHSKYIRMAGANKCVVCGSTERPTCGHMFSRRHMSTRWDIHHGGNCYVQCWTCNFHHGGLGKPGMGPSDKYPYWKWFIDRYGQDALDKLYHRHRIIRQWTLDELREMYEFMMREVMEGNAKMLSEPLR